MRHNSVSTIDGDFLQILVTAATGETAIEKAARRSCLDGEENIPEELKRLEVRFGELVAIDNAMGSEPKMHVAELETHLRQPRNAEGDDSTSDAASASLLRDRDGAES